jgi:hypothetical protein
MSMAYNGFVGLGKETAWGTSVSRATFLRFMSFEFQHNPNITPLEHSQSRYMHGSMFANYDFKFAGRFESRPDALGEFFRSMFSVEPVSTNPGTLAYNHVFTPSPEGTTPILAPYTVESRFGTANVAEVGSGGLVNEMTVAWDNNMVFIDVAGMCRKPSTGAPTALGSYAPSRPFMYHQLELTPNTFFGDGTNAKGVRSGSIQFVDETTQEWASQDRFFERPERGRLRANVQLQMVFDDLRDMRRHWDDAGVTTEPVAVDAPERALNFKWVGSEIEAGQNYEMEFDFTKMVMQPPQKPQSAGEQILQTVVLTASYDEGASKFMTARLKNTVDAY